MSILPAAANPFLKDFTLSPTDSVDHSELGISQPASSVNIAYTPVPPLDMVRSASATVESPSHSEKALQGQTAVMAAPPPPQAAATKTVLTTKSGSAATSLPPPPPPPLPVALAQPSAEDENAKTKNQNLHRNVYISGIPPTYRSEEFRHLCMQFGRVEAAKLCLDNRNAPTKAYGFALYFSEESAAAAIRGLNGSFLLGRCVQARLADSHATPQPLGEAGSALNTTIPPPAHVQRRYEQGEQRGGAVGNGRRGRQQNGFGGAGHDGASMQVPAPAYSALPMPPPPPMLGALNTAAPPAAMPMDMSAFYPYMAMMAAAPAATTTPPPSMAGLTPASNTTNPRSISPESIYATANAAGNNGGGAFGAIGTPVTAPLSAGSHQLLGGQPPSMHSNNNNNNAISPASLALSPALLSSHSTDSAGSQSPTVSRVSAVVANANYTPAAPFCLPFNSLQQQQQQQQQQQAMMMAAGMPVTNAMEGGQAVMYYPLPNGGVGMFTAPSAGGAMLPASIATMPTPMGATGVSMAKNEMAQLPASMMYFTMPPTVQSQMGVLPMAAPPQMPGSYMAFDGRNYGMPYQMVPPS